MTRKLTNKNILPILAITVLLLSVSLVNYNDSMVLSSQVNQNVLSESDEVEPEESEDDEDETEVEEEDESRDDRSGSDDSIQVDEEIEVEEEDELEDSKSDEDESETEFEEESEIKSSDGTTSKFKLKIKTKTSSGKTLIETSSGEIEVEKDPDDAINDLVESGVIDEPISFEAKSNNREKVEFEIQGTDTKRFLGIFKVVIPKIITVSSDTGEIVSTSQNFWSRILSLLSV